MPDEPIGVGRDATVTNDKARDSVGTPPGVGEVLTGAEIEARFDHEWVLLEDVEVNEYDEVLRGRLLWHSPNVDEVQAKVGELPRCFSVALFYVGLPDPDLIFML